MSAIWQQRRVADCLFRYNNIGGFIMTSALIPVLLGIIIIGLGVSNMKGNISSIHWYHRQRVTEADRIPFGKAVGLGTIIMGAGIAVFGYLNFAAEKTQNDIFVAIGSVILIAALVVGLVISFWAMIKYNKGIF